MGKGRVQSGCRWVFAAFAVAVACGPVRAAPCTPELIPLRAPLPLDILAPQGICVDPKDGTLWITGGLTRDILHLSPELEILGRFRADIPVKPGEGLTGIACDPVRDTLLVVRPIGLEVVEVAKQPSPEAPSLLQPTGRAIRLPLEPPPNIVPKPFPKGIAYDASGDGGRGSLWVVEAVMTKIYELSLDPDPAILSSFCHPDDPDGCPGEGRAARASAVGLYPPGDAPQALELVGGRERRDRLFRVSFEGERLWPVWDLRVTGGNPSGFARGIYRDPATGTETRALFVLVDSSAELHVFESVDSDFAPPRDFSAAALGSAVELTWTNRAAYDVIEIRREGEPIAAIEGTAERFADQDPPDGLIEYEIVARSGECSSALSAEVFTGPGRVLRAVHLPDRQLVDFTEDVRGLLWGAFADNTIGIFEKDLTEIVSFAGPFQEPDDVTGGIAYVPERDTVLVYNSARQLIAEIDTAGEIVSGPFPSGMPEDAIVPAMLYNPEGAGGAGSVWLVDALRARIEERTLSGELLRACVHPDELREPPPPFAPVDVCGRTVNPFLRTQIWGLTTPPANGGIGILETPAGTARDGRALRILRLDPETCGEVGFDVRLDDAARFRAPYLTGLHHTFDGDLEVYYLSLQVGFKDAWLLEVEARPPKVPAPAPLSVSQPGQEPLVEIRFAADASLDAVEILRDGERIAQVAPAAQVFTDDSVAPGFHEYGLRGVRAGERSEVRSLSVQVGPGSIARRGFTFPASFLVDVTYDPATETYFAASSNPLLSSCIYRYSRDFEFSGEIPSPFRLPEEIAALAVRSLGGSSEIYCLGWNRAQARPRASLPVAVIDPQGRVLRRFEVAVPPPAGWRVTFPAGLAWNSALDTFVFFERNSESLVRFSPEGEVLAVVKHPAPPFQDVVVDFGVFADGRRSAYYVPSAGTNDFLSSRIIELTPAGRPTGFGIPVGNGTYTRIYGFTGDPEGEGFVVSAMRGSLSEFAVHRAFDPVPPVRGLSCSLEGERVSLTWENAADYDAIKVYRGMELAETLPGSAASWTDTEGVREDVFYRVVPLRGSFAAPAALCDTPVIRPFTRGEVEENGRIDLSDAVYVLRFLFSGGPPPACFDAADTDDNGALEITDAVALLVYLFRSGAPPAQPHPLPGYDPTPDGLFCP